MKIWLLLPVCLLPVTLGTAELVRLLRRVRLLQGLAEMFSMMPSLLRSLLPEALQLYECLATYGCGVSLPEDIRRLLEEGISFEKAWRETVENNRQLRVLQKEEREELCAFSTRFGKYDTQEQCRICDGYASRYHAFAVQAKNQLEKNKKLYPAAGLLCSALLFILLL